MTPGGTRAATLQQGTPTPRAALRQQQAAAATLDNRPPFITGPALIKPVRLLQDFGILHMNI